MFIKISKAWVVGSICDLPRGTNVRSVREIIDMLYSRTIYLYMLCALRLSFLGLFLPYTVGLGTANCRMLPWCLCVTQMAGRCIRRLLEALRGFPAVINEVDNSRRYAF